MNRLCAFAFVMAIAVQVQAQDSPSDAHAAALGRAWTALAQGKPGDAAAAADEALRSRPRSHEAIGVKIAALAATDPGRALDAYDGWIRSTEDVFLLEPVARVVLERIAAGDDAGLQVAALEQLAAAGVASARTRLVELRTRSQNQAAGVALARLGDRQAATTLVSAAQEGGVRPETAAQLFAAAGEAGIPGLRQLLTTAPTPVRADAARALGKLGAKGAVDDLRHAMAEPDPLLSASAAVALTMLGDLQGETRTNQMLDSDLADFRLMAAEAYAARGDGRWVTAIMPLLRDENPLTRLQAARLIAPVNPDAARDVLVQSAADQNPVVRQEALKALASQGAASAAKIDLAELRRLLRDGNPAIRLHAAEVIMALATR